MLEHLWKSNIQFFTQKKKQENFIKSIKLNLTKKIRYYILLFVDPFKFGFCFLFFFVKLLATISLQLHLIPVCVAAVSLTTFVTV